MVTPIRVAVLGSGAREHALAARIAESPLCAGVIALPGNDGMARAGIRIHAAGALAPAAWGSSRGDGKPWLLEALKKEKIDLVVVGPDDLLAAGIVDSLEKEGWLVFGPSKNAARIESSKSFAKEVMSRAGVPTARYERVTEDGGAIAAAAGRLGGFPLVLKYDGLAMGKGVRVCASEAEAAAFLRDVFEDRRFERGNDGTGPSVLAEEYVLGHEVSLFAITDGTDYALLEPACDYKRLLDGDQGPNTGGMGAYSPVPWLPRGQLLSISDQVFPPVLNELKAMESSFKGLLYAGLMVSGGDFRVLEFNARFGDPETQAILPRLSSDLLPLLHCAAHGQGLKRHIEANPLRWSESACVNIVGASRGYPGKPEVGFEITGTSAIEPQTRVYYAGVKAGDGKSNSLFTSGGRVLGVSALAPTLDEARRKALLAMDQVRFEGMQHRTDIGRVGELF